MVVSMPGFLDAFRIPSVSNMSRGNGCRSYPDAGKSQELPGAHQSRSLRKTETLFLQTKSGPATEQVLKTIGQMDAETSPQPHKDSSTGTNKQCSDEPQMVPSLGVERMETAVPLEWRVQRAENRLAHLSHHQGLLPTCGVKDLAMVLWWRQVHQPFNFKLEGKKLRNNYQLCWSF